MSHWTFLFLVQALKSKQRLAIHKALQFLGDLFLAQGERNTATSLFAVAMVNIQTKLDRAMENYQAIVRAVLANCADHSCR
ncbi:hypothetical protein B0H13DRAFT_2335193 [Mycena leptocephala]|nr:hypothetical protein B0H13DRAFT_2335193 [Mycena leptocephala]